MTTQIPTAPVPSTGPTASPDGPTASPDGGAPLPPLPPVPGVRPDRHEVAGASVYAQLGSDHAAIQTLCRRLTEERTSGRARRDARVDILVATVARHLSAEEQYLYPAVRATLPDGAGLADREIGMDQRIQQALADLDAAGPDAADFDVRLLTALDLLAGHIDRVQQELFPQLRERLSTQEEIRLGNRVAIAREAAPTRPHPVAPATPPWNKLIDPGLGVLDKVRDALVRRRTRVEDPGTG